MGKLSFFKTVKVSDRITRIIGITEELMYLVEGDEKAVLIDTGMGVGDLRELVESLTKKPLMVLLTHGHVDHAMGAPVFDDVYMNPADEKAYCQHMDMGGRKGYIELTAPELFAQIKESDYIEPKKLVYKPLMPGDVFSLGGITLEIYGAKGHTPGSVAILFKEDRILLLGDACNTRTFLFDENSSSVNEYKASLETLDKETKGKYDRAFFSHGPGEDGVEMISSVIKLCEEILEGKADDVPFEFMGITASLAKKVDADGNRVDKGLGNIVYTKN